MAIEVDISLQKVPKSQEERQKAMAEVSSLGVDIECRMKKT